MPVKGSTGRDGATGAGIAALEGNFTDAEADDAALVFAEETIFPESRALLSFQERFGKRRRTSSRVRPGNHSRDGLERSGGDDGGATGDGVVGEAAGGVADDDLLLEENAKPFDGIFVAAGKSKVRAGMWRLSPGAERVTLLEMGNSWRGCVDGEALAIDPATVDGIESPGAIEGESTGRADAAFGDGMGSRALMG